MILGTGTSTPGKATTSSEVAKLVARQAERMSLSMQQEIKIIDSYTLQHLADLTLSELGHIITHPNSVMVQKFFRKFMEEKGGIRRSWLT